MQTTYLNGVVYMVFQIGQPHASLSFWPLVRLGYPLSTPPSRKSCTTSIQFVCLKKTMEKQPFEQLLANSMTTPELKSEQIRLAVLKHCQNSGFISKQDQEDNSSRYEWLLETVELNLLSLNLLDQIILDVSYPLFPLDVKTEIDAKAASIVKNIAKRVMATDIQYPSPSSGDSTSSSKQKLDMK